MKISKLIGWCAGMIIALQVNAQQTEWCGSNKLIERRIANDPQLAEKYLNTLDSLKALAANPITDASRAGGNVIYIPVVFHIVHNGDAVGTNENITDAQVMSQLDAMNRDFNYGDPDIANVPGVFQNLVANCGIKFCLAKFDPSGNPTTGIIRHQFPQATWNTDTAIDNTLKPATIWDHTKYLNIWTVNMGGTLLSQGVLAYASLPYFGTANQDGIVSRYNTTGTIGNVMSGYRKGKTISHEAGHYFGLLHTWGTQAGCGGQGDFIADTPDQYDMNFGCPAFPHISCNNGPNGDMFMNYMDYTDDDCRNMFTIGQSNQMQSVLNSTRSQLKNASTKCFYSLDGAVASVLFPTDTVCTLNFKPIITIKNEGLTTLVSAKLYYQIDGGAVQIYTWSGSIASQDEEQVTLPEQAVAAGSHTFDVTISNVNSQSSDNFAGNDSKSSSFFVYNGSAGNNATFNEGFEGSFPATNWTISNPNLDYTWEKNTFFGAYGQSASSIVIDNYSYTSNPNKKRDALITDVYNLSNINNPILTFDVAYARYDANRSDSLNIYYSLNCGSTWILALAQGGTDIATAANTTDYFIPTSAQWKTVSVNLASIAGQSNVSFKFENVTGWGNAMYLDNINLSNNGASAINEVKRADVKVFPNPANDLVGIRLPFNHSFKNIQLLNAMGQVVYSQMLNDNAVIISTDQLPEGLYFIHLNGDKISQTEKLLIAR